MGPAELAEQVRTRFPETLHARGEVTVTVAADGLLPALEHLRETEGLKFDFLSSVTASDWPDLDPRFWLAYHLLSNSFHHRIRVKVGAPGPDPRVPSVTGMFPAANWYEREVFDFYGVVFDGHPDLRRIEMPEGWKGHPMRKTEGMGGVNTQFKGAFIPPPDQRGV